MKNKRFGSLIKNNNIDKLLAKSSKRQRKTTQDNKIRDQKWCITEEFRKSGKNILL